MPSIMSILFLLASVAMEKRKQHMLGKFINGNSGKSRKKMNNTKIRKNGLTHFLGQYPATYTMLYFKKMKVKSKADNEITLMF